MILNDPRDVASIGPLPAGTRYLVYDIETIRDPALPPAELDQFGKEPFPSAPECEVVSIAALAISGGEPRRKGSSEDEPAASIPAIPEHGIFTRPIVLGVGMSEERKLWAFARLVDANPDIRLVSWNGRGFDAPVIAARLFKYGWPSPTYVNDHRYRFAKPGPGMHLDLCDQLSDFGAGRRAKLDSFARIMGLPGKVFGDGAGVAAQIAAGKAAEVDRYCLTDVLQTAYVLLRWLVLSGSMSREQYRTVARANWQEVGELFEGQLDAVDLPALYLDRKGLSK